MKKINPDKVSTEFLTGVTKISPVDKRKYTVTHSDLTGQLFVTIGLRFATDKINETRDEVFLEWHVSSKKPMLFGSVLVDNDVITKNASIRNTIFIKEMPSALQAIRYGDRALFEKYPMLDKVPIYIYFSSKNAQYNRIRYFGTMSMYLIE